MPDLTTHAVLKHNLLFYGLPGTSIDAVASLAHRGFYKKNSLVFSQGDEGDALVGCFVIFWIKNVQTQRPVADRFIDSFLTRR